MIDCQGNVEPKAHKMARTLASYGKGAKLNLYIQLIQLHCNVDAANWGWYTLDSEAVVIWPRDPRRRNVAWSIACVGV
eukprot:scaffold358_cov207-Alexandrium_tamarense.AAC.36